MQNCKLVYEGFSSLYLMATHQEESYHMTQKFPTLFIILSAPTPKKEIPV